jgi:uncharacterized membrane protein YgdD (TMEM256/DUF423 family)
MNAKVWLLAGIVFGMLAVVLGAFGAHGLQRAVTTWDLTPEEQLQRLHNWEVGVRYQMYHALALVALGLYATLRPAAGLNVAGAMFVAGVAVFSGFLYLYVFSGVRWFGMIVPIGGVALIVGWLLFGFAVWRGADLKI